MSAPPTTGRRLRPILAGALGALAAAALAAPGAEGARDFPAASSGARRSPAFRPRAGNGRDVDPNAATGACGPTTPRTSPTGPVSGDQPEQGPGYWRRFRSDLEARRRPAPQQRLPVLDRVARGSSRAPREDVDVGAQHLPRRARAARPPRQPGRVRHYRAMLRVDRKRGLTPFVTLHHFTLPSWLHDPVATRDALAGVGPGRRRRRARRGGWLDRDTVAEFRKYAAYLAWKLGGRVDLLEADQRAARRPAYGYVNMPGRVRAAISRRGRSRSPAPSPACTTSSAPTPSPTTRSSASTAAARASGPVRQHDRLHPLRPALGGRPAAPPTTPTTCSTAST